MKTKNHQFLNKNSKLVILPHECGEGDKITVRNLQNQNNPHNMEEAGDTIPQMCRISKPFSWWHLQTFVAYQVSAERRA